MSNRQGTHVVSAMVVFEDGLARKGEYRRFSVRGTGGEGDIGRLTITYPWNLMTPLIRPFFTNGQLVIRVESAMKNERRFTSD